MSEHGTYGMNPNLLNPNDPGGNRVSPVVGHTPAFPIKFQEQERHYVCTVPNHHMHRKDGKRLAFVHGFLTTRDIFDIQYLDEEIANGNPYIRVATEDEVHSYSMRMNPRKVISEEIRPDVEAQVRNEFTAKLLALGIPLTDEQRKSLGLPENVGNIDTLISGEIAADSLEKHIEQQKLQGVDALKTAMSREGKGVNVGSGVLLAKPVESSKVADRIAENKAKNEEQKLEAAEAQRLKDLYNKSLMDNTHQQSHTPPTTLQSSVTGTDKFPNQAG